MLLSRTFGPGIWLAGCHQLSEMVQKSCGQCGESHAIVMGHGRMIRSGMSRQIFPIAVKSQVYSEHCSPF